MSDDIVTRLRKPLPYNLVGLTTKDLGNERYEAADEIERLRAELKRWEVCDLVAESICGWDTEKTYCNPCKAVRGE